MRRNVARSRWKVGRRQAWTALVVVVGLALVGFAVWATLLVADVSGLRADVTTRVDWLQRLHGLQIRAQAADLEPATITAIDEELDRLVDEIVTDRHTEGELLTAIGSRAHADEEPLVRIGWLVPRIREENTSLSLTLGERWEEIRWLAGISLALAASTLALLIYVRFVLLRRARRTVTNLEAHLRDADRLVAVGTLAAGVAHEINNPLTYIVTNLELLQRELDPEGTPYELANEALQGAERVMGIVRDLRSVARPTRDDISACDVEACLDAALGITRTELRRVAQVVRDYGGAPPVWGSDARLIQLFLNLVINAAHAMAGGDPESHVLRVTTRRAKLGMVEIELADTGPGVPPELQRRVFEPFVTTKPLGQGTGLGLFVCHNIVTALDGEIELVSSPQGATVRIRLPSAYTSMTGEASSQWSDPSDAPSPRTERG
jgi:signal transduction histidine kinase